MINKDVRLPEGNSFDKGYFIGGKSGPVDLTTDGTLILATLTDLSGDRIIRYMEVFDVDFDNGLFSVHLDPEATLGLRGRYRWQVKLIRGESVVTLVSGDFTVERDA